MLWKAKMEPSYKENLEKRGWILKLSFISFSLLKTTGIDLSCQTEFSSIFPVFFWCLVLWVCGSVLVKDPQEQSYFMAFYNDKDIGSAFLRQVPVFLKGRVFGVQWAQHLDMA